MESPSILALDLGAESGRAVLACVEGDRIKLQEVHRFPNEPVSTGGHLYWDALRLFAETRRGMGHGARRAGGRLSSTGLCT
jgi:sugar (pentulose or hexulose) kinase